MWRLSQSQKHPYLTRLDLPLCLAVLLPHVAVIVARRDELPAQTFQPVDTAIGP